MPTSITLHNNKIKLYIIDSLSLHFLQLLLLLIHLLHILYVGDLPVIDFEPVLQEKVLLDKVPIRVPGVLVSEVFLYCIKK